MMEKNNQPIQPFNHPRKEHNKYRKMQQYRKKSCMIKKYISLYQVPATLTVRNFIPGDNIYNNLCWFCYVMMMKYYEIL